MKYFKLIADDSPKRRNDIVCYTEDNFESKFNISQYDLSDGIYIREWDENITFYYDPKEGSVQSDYLSNDLGWFIISSSMRNILEEMSISDIQYLPIVVRSIKDNTEIRGYTVVNLTKLTDGLNKKYCNYEEYDLGDKKLYSMLGKYVLDKEYIKGMDILRLEGTSDSLFVSERLKKAIQLKNLTGCAFLEVEVR